MNHYARCTANDSNLSDNLISTARRMAGALSRLRAEQYAGSSDDEKKRVSEINGSSWLSIWRGVT